MVDPIQNLYYKPILQLYGISIYWLPYEKWKSYAIKEILNTLNSFEKRKLITIYKLAVWPNITIALSEIITTSFLLIFC